MHDANPQHPVGAQSQLCALYAREARDLYPDRSWQEIEPLLQRVWEAEPGNQPWRSARDTVRSFWCAGG